MIIYGDPSHPINIEIDLELLAGPPGWLISRSPRSLNNEDQARQTGE
jgi:hypothetical protein